MTTALQETVLEVLDPRLLLEMAWEDLLGFQADDYELADNLEALYELEYKYSMLRTRTFEGVPQRREKMLERLGGVAYELASTIAEQILGVYENWLSAHAISDPDQWAEARVREFAGETDYGDHLSGDAIGRVIQNLFSEYDEYVRYGGEIRPWNPYSGGPKVQGPETSEIAQAVREGSLPSLEAVAAALMDEDNEQQAGEEGFEPHDDVADYLEIQLDGYGSLHALVSGLNWDYVDASPYKLLEELYKVFVFQAWWEFWEAKGIVETRQRIEDASNVLKAISSSPQQFPVQQLLGKVNEIINLTHQTGDMMEYIESLYNLNAGDLEELSSRDTTDWDEELQTLGVQIDGRDTQGDAEAAERAGPAPA